MKKKKIVLLFGASLLLGSCSITDLINGKKEDVVETKHNLVKVDEVAATCLEDGVREHYICSDAGCENICFDSKGNEVRRSSLIIEALGHNFQEDPQMRYLASLPTCNTKGKYFEACSRCGTKGTKTFFGGDTLPHVYDEVVIEPTLGGATIDHKNNTFTIEFTASKSCENCSHIESETKTGELVIEEGQDATCTADGQGKIVVQFSEDFGGKYTKNVKIDKTGHKIEGVSFSSDDSKHWKVCENCGEKIGEESHVFAHKHNESKHWNECETCAKVLNEENHTFGERVVTLIDFDLGKVCATLTCSDPDCGYEKIEEKVGTINTITPAGCTDAGLATVNVTFSEEFGGAYNDEIVLPAKGHNSDKILDHDANEHFYHCTECKQKIDIEAHSASNYSVTSYPTDTDLGEREGVCNKCGVDFTQAFGQCETGNHVGGHFTGKEPTMLEAGFSGFYYCDTCHKTILDKDHVDNDGTWEEKGVASDITSEHKAYLEPTVTAADIIGMIDSVGTSLTKGALPTLLDKLALEKIDTYKAVYLSKKGTFESDITNMDTYRGLKNSLSYSSFERTLDISGKPQDSSTYNLYSWNGDVTRDKEDESNGLKYASVRITNALEKWKDAIYFNKYIFGDVTTDLLIYVRPSIDTSFHYYINGKRSVSQINTPANKWSAIKIPYSYFKGLQDAEEKGWCYLSNNDVLAVGTTVDVSDFYTFNSIDLTSYNVVSNEGYNTLWQAGGLTGKLTDTLHNQPLFNGVKEVDFHPSYRNYFFEIAITNGSGIDKKASDLLVSNSYYAGLYFGTGSYTFNKTVSEAFFMVYSNEEVDIEYAGFGDIVRKGQENNSHATVETKLYKGWNTVHIDFAKVSSTINVSGHLFSLVPSTWSTTLELTMTAMFYKAA